MKTVVCERFYGKMLIVIFDDEEGTAFDHVLEFIAKEKHIKRINVFQVGNLLQYGNLEITPEKKSVKLSGNHVELTN